MKKKYNLFLLIVGLFTSTTVLPNDYVYVVNGDGTVAVFDAVTYLEIPGSPFASILPPPPSSTNPQVTISLSSDGLKAFIPGFQAANTVAAFNIDPVTGALSHIPGSPVSGFNSPFSSAIRSDNSFVYITNFASDTVAICDINLNILGTVPTSSNPATIIISPDQTHVYIACAGASEVMRFDIINSPPYLINPISASIAPGITPYVVAMDPSGTYVYATSLAGGVSITRFDSNLSNPVQTGSSGTFTISIAFASGGSKLFLSSLTGQTVHVLDPVSLIELDSFSVGSTPFVIAVNPDKTLLYVTNNTSNTISVFDLTQPGYTAITNSPFSFIPPLVGPYGLAFTPNAAPLIQPPSGFRGKQKSNNFGFQYELFNQLEWGSPAQGVAAEYILYRENIEIARLTGNTFTYEDHNIKKNTPVIYSIKAVDSSGNQSSPATITVK